MDQRRSWERWRVHTNKRTPVTLLKQLSWMPKRYTDRKTRRGNRNLSTYMYFDEGACDGSHSFSKATKVETIIYCINWLANIEQPRSVYVSCIWNLKFWFHTSDVTSGIHISCFLASALPSWPVRALTDGLNYPCLSGLLGRKRYLISEMTLIKCGSLVKCYSAIGSIIYIL